MTACVNRSARDTDRWPHTLPFDAVGAQAACFPLLAVMIMLIWDEVG